jgi:hypothetical protein
MADIARFALQALFYLAFGSLIGFFASRPAYEQLAADHAQIKLSLVHGAARRETCRRLTPQEIARLPPSERRPNTCERERLPIEVELALDGEVIYTATLEPTGLAKDGPARTYRKFAVPTGPHMITARLRDSDRAEGFDYERTVAVELAPLQNLAIDFKADAGGFVFR